MNKHRQFKRLLAFFLAMTLALAMIPAVAFAASDDEGAGPAIESESPGDVGANVPTDPPAADPPAPAPAPEPPAAEPPAAEPPADPPKPPADNGNAATPPENNGTGDAEGATDGDGQAGLDEDAAEATFDIAAGFQAMEFMAMDEMLELFEAGDIGITVNFLGIEGVTMQYYISGWNSISGTYDNSAAVTLPEGTTSVRAVKAGMYYQIDGLSDASDGQTFNVPVSTITVTGVSADCSLGISQGSWVYGSAPADVGIPNSFSVFDNGRAYSVQVARTGYNPVTIPNVSAGDSVWLNVFYNIAVPDGVSNVRISNASWVDASIWYSGYLGSDAITLMQNDRPATLYFTYNGTEYTVNFTLDGVTNPFDLADLDPPVQEYTVTFDSAGGSAVPPQTLPADSLVTKPADPTRAGYTFVGWWYIATDGSYTVEYNFAEMRVNWDITLTAVWEEETVYRINFYSNGGLFPGNLDNTGWQTLYWNDDIDAFWPAAVPTRAGYTFTGWTDDIAGGNPITQDMTYAQAAYGNSTITWLSVWAQWEPRTFSVTIIVDGFDQADITAPITNSGADYDGTGLPFVQIVYTADDANTWGDVFGILPVPAKTGYAFLGWELYAGGAFTEANFPPANLLPFDDTGITIRPTWEMRTFSVVIIIDGFVLGDIDPLMVDNSGADYAGTGLPFAQIIYTGDGLKGDTWADVFGILPVPAKVGYAFTGWELYAGGAFTEANFPPANYLPFDNAGITIRPTWEMRTFSVIMIVDGFDPSLFPPGLIDNSGADYGGTGLPFEQIIYTGDGLKGTTWADVFSVLPVPAKAGFTFLGWELFAGGAFTEANFPLGNTLPFDNNGITIRPIWEEITEEDPGESGNGTTNKPKPDTPPPAKEKTTSTPAPVKKATVVLNSESPTTGMSEWALLNLILAILTAAIMAFALSSVYRKRKETIDVMEEETPESGKAGRVGLGLMLATVAIAIASFIIFFVTEDFNLPMGLVDQYTFWHMGTMVIAGVFTALLVRGGAKVEPDNA